MHRLLAKVHHYLGMDLPARTLPLNFTLPLVSGRFKASHTGDNDLVNDLNEAKDSPLECFRLLLGEIRYINRCTMKQRERLELTRDILKLFYPTALAQLARQATRGGVPDPEDRSKLLDMLADIAQILAVSYQILFTEFYLGSNFKYARSRNIVNECASRMLELLIIKQQSRSLRYQLMSEQDWQLANTIFYVMSCYEDVERPLSTLNKELKVGGRRNDTSLREQFALLHTVAKFDMLRWPTHLQWVVGSYFYSVENAVLARADDGNSRLGRNEMIAYCYDVSQARGARLETPPGPAIILSYSGLAEAILKDCMGMLLAKKSNSNSAMPPRFARFPETEHFVLSDKLLRGLENSVIGTVAEQERSLEDLRIFVGFSDAFELLSHKQGKFAAEDRLEDMLAKRSALIAEDNVATEKSMWSLLFQNESMARLSTQETSFTTPMSIGSLLAYGIGEDISRPSFAVVSRIFRPSLKLVVIDMQLIANYAEPVLISMNTSDKMASISDQTKPALLLYDMQRLGGWGLMFPPRDIVPGVDRLSIYRRKKMIELNLDNMRNATNDFYLFATSLTSEQLGVEGQPDYANSSGRKTRAAGWLI